MEQCAKFITESDSYHSFFSLAISGYEDPLATSDEDNLSSCFHLVPRSSPKHQSLHLSEKFLRYIIFWNLEDSPPPEKKSG